MAALPISGKEITLREISGAEDMLLLGGGDSVPRLVRDLLAALAGGDAASIDCLPVGDAESLLLALRLALLGETVQADMLCPADDCGARIDVTFRVSDYLSHRTPRKVCLSASAGDGWLSDERSGLTFRFPTLADQIAVSGRAHPSLALLRLCIRDDEKSARARRKANALLDKAAPTLSNYVTGECPECGTRVEAYFDVEQFVLRELRETAVRLYDDVHRIAAAYGWSEDEIVSLPRSRRIAYAERIGSDEVPS